MTTPENRPEARRRSPGWVRSLEAGDVHALALRLRRKMFELDASDREEWLFDACVSELEWRRRHALRFGARCCSCELCVPPFEDLDDPRPWGPGVTHGGD